MTRAKKFSRSPRAENGCRGRVTETVHANLVSLFPSEKSGQAHPPPIRLNAYLDQKVQAVGMQTGFSTAGFVR
jgi:hypothetical protein